MHVCASVRVCVYVYVSACVWVWVWVCVCVCTCARGGGYIKLTVRFAFRLQEGKPSARQGASVSQWNQYQGARSWVREPAAPLLCPFALWNERSPSRVLIFFSVWWL